MAKKKKKKGLFDHLNAVKKNKDPEYWGKLSRADKKTWSTYMINRFLSMNEQWVDIINDLQPYTGIMEDKDVYRLYADLFPYDSSYYKYIKGKKDRDYPDWVINILVEHYQISMGEAKDYMEIYLSTHERKEMLIELCRKYGKDQKQLNEVSRLHVKS